MQLREQRYHSPNHKSQLLFSFQFWTNSKAGEAQHKLRLRLNCMRLHPPDVSIFLRISNGQRFILFKQVVRPYQ